MQHGCDKAVEHTLYQYFIYCQHCCANNRKISKTTYNLHHKENNKIVELYSYSDFKKTHKLQKTKHFKDAIYNKNDIGHTPSGYMS